MADSSRKKLLWIGDAVASTGFARITHHVLDVVRETWGVHVLGLNYRGDPHDYPYSIYPAWPGGDLFGVGRVKDLIRQIQPDAVVILQDPWNIPEYMENIPESVPVIAHLAVDGKSFNAKAVEKTAHCVFWTQFGLDEARIAGYTGTSSVIPLGVDLDIYKPSGMTKQEARKSFRFPETVQSAYIVGNVNRNQPRKRLDLSIAYFAQWVKEYNIKDAYLLLHVAPTGDNGYDPERLMAFHGVNGRLIVIRPNVMNGGIPEQHLATLYECLDVQISTTQGEGWGLCTMEGMACGIPQIVPDWSALGEWPEDAVMKIPCFDTYTTPIASISTVGGVPSRPHFVSAINRVYNDPFARTELTRRGLELVRKPAFRWRSIGERFVSALEEVVSRGQDQVQGTAGDEEATPGATREVSQEGGQGCQEVVRGCP